MLLVSAVALGSCDAPGDPADVPAATEAMIARLAPLASETDPSVNRFANEAIVEALLARTVPFDVQQRILLQRQVAEQLMYAGRFEEAIAQFDAVLIALDEFNSSAPPHVRAPPDFRTGIVDLLAAAHLRLAEQTHCIEQGQATDCALPRPENPWGPDAQLDAAIGLYLEQLADDPDAPGPRWMLNLAHMLRGDWPGAVPARWRIDPAVFEPEYDIGDFQNMAGELGVDVPGNVGGTIADDFNGDGWIDLMTSSWGPADTLRFFLADAGGGFVDRTAESGLVGLSGGGNLVQADYDNDGDLDVFVPRGGWLAVGQPNSLLRNRGDGTFEDVTEGAGLLLDPRPTQTAVWADVDLDGWLDLFVGNETYRDTDHPAQLFLNQRDGTFREVGAEAGVDVVGIIKGVAAGDIDNDGDADLYVTRIDASNVLLRNDGTRGGLPRFTDITATSGTADPTDAFPAWFFDYDNDGFEDLFVAGYRTNYGDALAEYLGRPHDSELSRLYRNRGDGTFTDVSAEVGLDRILFAMGSNYGDLDNDGWLDLFIGTGDAFFQALMPNRVFRNAGGERFQEVTASTHFGLYQKGHGVAFADLDHDGDQDIYMTMGGAYSGDLGRNVLYRNPGHGRGWITLILEGTGTNRSAIGARVRLTASTADGPRTLHRTVHSGGSFGASTLRVEVGLGAAGGPVDIEIDWPEGGSERFEGVAPNSIYRITEEAGRIEPADLSTVTLGGG